MAQVRVEELEKNTVKLTITVPHAEVEPYLKEAAAKIAESSTIPGFRPGKAPYEAVKGRVGEMKIYEAALEPIIRKTFVEAVTEHKIETVGSPKIDLEKMAPGNDIVFSAEVAKMPKISRLADLDKIEVKAEDAEVSDEDIDLVLKDLQRMQTKEVRAKKDAAATESDKVVVSVNMKKDGAPVEGGQSPNHAVHLKEDYYIPGFKDKIIGMKEGEEKTFTLPFPKDHSQKMLAGADIEFEVTLNEIYHLESPEITDEFAKALGQKDLKGLKDILKSNMENERGAEEKARQEKVMLEEIAEKSRFDDIPDLLVNEEVNKMIQELKHRVEEQGVEFNAYLENMKKSLADLKLDLTPQALTRIKVALAIREIAEQEKISVSAEEVDTELDKTAKKYEENKEIQKQIYSPVYREYMETSLRNRKVIEFLQKKILK